MTQTQALEILKTGANVFLTGEPGSGKTYTIREYVRYLRDQNIEPAITASTGIAATHIGGMTIHSWSGIGIKTRLDKYALDKIASTEYVVKRVRKARILIIDEVSMLPAETLSMVDAVIREIKQNSDPFGGLQIVLVGDFFQLPPIMKPVETEEENKKLWDAPSARFASDSPVWNKLNPVVCYLEEQYRQDDAEFLRLLSAIRRNEFAQEHLAQIEARKFGDHSISPNAPKLYSHNADVDRINDEMLTRLMGSSRVFNMCSDGPALLVASLKKGCLSPDSLSLKRGAAVMFTKNNPKEHFVNGTLGTVGGFDGISGSPVVKTRAGRKISVKPMDWTLEENGRVRAKITQLPLRLAWAITVHKSQGMSLDEAVMDLSDVFEYGQGYVALSRIRRFSGLYLLGWNERAFQVHPDVLARDESFRDGSREAGAVFGKIAPDELATMRKNFISALGGKKISDNAGKKADDSDAKKIGFEKIRRAYPNAYRSWNKEDDEKLKELFSSEISLADIAETFGRKTGAIRSRLLKLGLAE